MLSFRAYLFPFAQFSCILLSCTAPAWAQPLVSTDLALEILHKEEILNVADRNRLKEFAGRLEANDHELTGLRALAMAVRNKVSRDLKNLSSLSYNLSELVENDYARTIGKVKERDIKKINKSIEGFQGLSKDLYAPRALDDDRPNKEEFVKIIKHDLALVAGDGGITSHAIWRMIKANFKDPYQRWNAHFRELEAAHIEPHNISDSYGIKRKVKFYDKSVSSSQQYLEMRSRYDVEQLEFLRDFDRARVGFRRLSNPDSGNF